MQKIGLLLLGKKGLISLKALKKYDLLEKVEFAVIGKDTSVQNDYSNDILKFCESNGIRGFSRKQFSDIKLSCDFLVAIGWRWFVNTDQYNLITIHDSLLPKYRGFNPLVTALIEGDTKVGATAILANEKIDAGDIIARESVEVEYPITIGETIDMIAQIYGKIIVKIFQSDNLNPEPQNHSDATYSIWRNEDDYRIDWTWDSDRIVRFIDAVGFPYLGALSTYQGNEIRIIEGSIEKDLHIVNRTPGKLFKIEKNTPSVVCGKGIVQIKKAVFENNAEEVTFDKLRVRLQ